MIPCICINDQNRPAEIPLADWVVEGDEYRIMWATYLFGQKVFAVQLYEKQLSKAKHYPYEFFLSERFQISEADLMAFIELLMNCMQLDYTSVTEIIQESNLELV